MKKQEFEALSSRTISLALTCGDKMGLLKTAKRLLDADVAVLVDNDLLSKSGESRTIAVWPEEYRPLVDDAVGRLLQMYALEDLKSLERGYSISEEIDIGGNKFFSSLVAFSLFRKLENTPRYELILLSKKGGENRYSSYHCWAAAVLLSNYEAFNQRAEIDGLNTKLSEEKRNIKKLTTDIHEVLPSYDCEQVIESARSLSGPEKAKRYIVWLAERIRQVNRAKSISEGNSFVIRDCNILMNELGLFEDLDVKQKHVLQEMIQLFCRQEPKEENHFAIAEWIRFFESNNEYISNREFIAEYHYCLLLLVEYGWRTIRMDSQRNIYDLRRQCDIQMLSDMAIHISYLSAALIAHKICNDSVRDGRQLEIGRGFLKLYLALNVFSSKKLENLYLRSSFSSYLKAPHELKRSYMLNLSRFALSVVEIIRKEYLGKEDIRSATSAAEALDSLLQIVDRFIHVELEVDEQINIRQLLANQMADEIRHHMTKEHYRDHLLHVIDVFILGHLLLNTKIRWKEDQSMPLVDQLISSSVSPVGRAAWLKNWAVASLLHDIGYQIGQGRSITQEHDRWQSFFHLKPPIATEELEFKFEQKKQDIPQNERIRWLKHIGQFLCDRKELSTAISKDLLDAVTDHGVLSAFRIAQLCLNLDPKPIKESGEEDHSLVETYSEALHAIGHHNIHGQIVSFSNHPLSCLLRLCDELQEWNRYRVNNEKVVKNLYLDLQLTNQGAIQGYELFQSFTMNINIKPVRDGSCLPIEISSADFTGEENKPCIRSSLIYRDSLTGNFIPMLTLLSKAYNLQHINLSDMPSKNGDLTFSLDLMFPTPLEFKWITEYDIFGLFTEHDRRFGILQEYESILEAEAGLIRIRNDDAIGDRFGIIVKRSSDPQHRSGWLSVNPENCVQEYIRFRLKYLSDRRIPV